MPRFCLTDAQWVKMEPFVLASPRSRAAPGSDGRLFLEAILWIARTGSPWRDLPPAFGKWNTVFKRFRDWVKADVFKRMFDAVSDDPDMGIRDDRRHHRQGSTAMDKRAKGGLRASHRQVPRAAGPPKSSCSLTRSAIWSASF